jgi:predicted DNA-binding transcriptional regulator YafY
MFSTDEIEAIAVAMRMLRRTGDAGLQAAAETVLSKVTVAVPDALRAHLTEPPFVVSRRGAPPPPVADLAAIRAAIRNERKLRIGYGDEKGARTERTIWPFAIAYCAESTLVNAWCELRDDFRHFRADRILDQNMLDENFPISGKTLFARWQGRFGFEDKTNTNSSPHHVTATRERPEQAQLRRRARQ